RFPWGGDVFAKCLLLHGKCRLKINLCGFNTFVTEPQGDHRTINAGLQKVHGHGVPQTVDSDTLVFSEGHTSEAVTRCLFSKYCTPVHAETFTFGVGNSTCPSPRCGSRNQAFNTASVDLAR